jgi:hypothetical protein
MLSNGYGQERSDGNFSKRGDVDCAQEYVLLGDWFVPFAGTES